MNDQVAAYRSLVESIATKMSASRRAQQVGAEFDDLVQEGLIAVWLSLEAGVTLVGKDRIRDRMRDYMRWLAADKRQPVPYEEMLSLELLRAEELHEPARDNDEDSA